MMYIVLWTSWKTFSSIPFDGYWNENCVIFFILVSEVMNVTNMIQFVKNNVDMVQSILKSLWTVIVGNVSLAFSAFASIINLVFGGGSAILNFLINLVSELNVPY